MSAIQTFRHYRISQDSQAAAVELWRTRNEVVCLAVDTLRQIFVELHVGISEPGTAREHKPFQQIASAATQLRHRNLLTILDSGEDEGANYYVTEFVDGERLETYLARTSPIPPWLALTIAGQITDGLQPLANQAVLLAGTDIYNSTIQLLGETPADLVIKVADLNLTVEPAKAALSIPTSTARIVDNLGQLLLYMLAGSMSETAAAGLEPELRFLLEAISQPVHQHHPATLEQLRQLIERTRSELPSAQSPKSGEKLDAALRPRLPLQAHFPNPAHLADFLSDDYTIDTTPFDSAQPYRHAATARSTRVPTTLQLLPPERLMPKDYSRSLRTAVQRINNLDHPNLLRIISISDEETPEFYMEEASGKHTLASVLRLKQGLSATEAVFVLEELLEANRQAEGCGLTPVVRSPGQIYVQFLDPRGESALPSETELSRASLENWPGFRLKVRTFPTTLNLAQQERFHPERLLPPGHAGLETSPSQKHSSIMTPVTTRDFALLAAAMIQGGKEISDKVRQHVFDSLRTRKGGPQVSPKEFVERLAALSGRTVATKTVAKKTASKKKKNSQIENPDALDLVEAEVTAGAMNDEYLMPLGSGVIDPPSPRSSGVGFAEALFGSQIPLDDEPIAPLSQNSIFQPLPFQPPAHGGRNFLEGPELPEMPEEDYSYLEEEPRKGSRTFMLLLLVILVAALVAGVMAHFTGRAFWVK